MSEIYLKMKQEAEKMSENSEIAEFTIKWPEVASVFTDGAMFERRRILTLLRSDDCAREFNTDNYFSSTLWGPKLAEWLEKKLAGGS